MLKNILNTALAALFMCMSCSTLANDSSVGDDNGSIIFLKQANISMDKEKLVIAKDKITVDYLFRNNSPKSKRVNMAFPMPAMYFGDGDHNEISDFKLTVNGNTTQTQRRFVVMLGDKDITKEIRQLGWDEKSLIRLAERDMPYDMSTEDRKLHPDWLSEGNMIRFTLHEYFMWQQYFPAKKTVRIQHSYSPSLSSSVPLAPSGIIEWNKKHACINKPTQAAIKQLGKYNQYGVINWAELSYILKTGNNWQGPIKDFHLVLKKDSPKDIISLCFKEKLKKTSPTTFEFKKKNFRPTQDLLILYASPITLTD